MSLGSPTPHLGGHATLYLIAALVCLLVALRNWRRAVQPLGSLVHAVAAAAMVAFATGVAVVLLIFALASLP